MSKKSKMPNEKPSITDINEIPEYQVVMPVIEPGKFTKTRILCPKCHNWKVLVENEVKCPVCDLTN